jgi:hypothetical protein
MLKVDWRRAVVFTHRWLGIGGCLLFVTWFASGIVMMYARMPELSNAERLARLPPLDLSTARLDPGSAFGHGMATLSLVRIGMLHGRPVYRAPDGRDWTTVYADDGQPFEGLTREAALDEAKRFAPEHAATIRYDARLVEPDQWTLQHARSLPLHRVALGDAGDAAIYLSERTGEVIAKTTAAARRIAYPGAVLHWLYFTPFRKHHELWTQTMTWLSALGTVMCALGLLWGFYNSSRLPFRGWLRWHHYIGLAFGVVSFTWIFSRPARWTPGRGMRTRRRTRNSARLSGGPLDASRVSLAELRDVAGRGVKEIEIVPFRGRPRLIADGRADHPIEQGEIGAALKASMPGVDQADVAWLTDYDDYYYDRDRAAPLPVVRARFRDAPGTWLYVDPNRGTILRKEERSSRVNRWLYHGLHSLDFPFLYRRRPLWDIVMIFLILGGVGSAATALVPAGRRLLRHATRWL